MVANGYVMVACVGELSNLRRGAMHVKNTVRPRRFTSDRRFNKGRTLGWSENPLQVIAQSIHSQTRTESVTPVGKYSQRPVNQTEKKDERHVLDISLSKTNKCRFIFNGSFQLTRGIHLHVNG